MPDLTNVVRLLASVKEGYTSALTSNITAGAATVPIDDLTDYSDGDTVVLVIDPDNSSKQVFTGVVDITNSQVTNAVWTEGSDVIHNSGAQIVDYVTSTHYAMLVKAIGSSGSSSYNVKNYGATGDGTTDDTTSLQATLAAASPGEEVFLPKGIYGITAPLVIPPGVTLRGTYANHTENVGSNWTDSATYIRPLAGFSGAAAVRLVDKEIASYSKDSNGQRIFNINLDGVNTTGSVDGLKAEGLVHGVVMRDVCIRKFANHNLFTTYYTRADTSVVNPYSWRMERVICDTTTTSYGISLNNLTDSTLIDVESINSGTSNWFLSGMGNSHLVNCRAEWAGEVGFHVDAGSDYNAVTFTSCSTDSNEQHGVYVTGDGTQPVVFNGLMTHRDGRNGGTGGGAYAGLFVDTCTAPVIVDGIAVSCGVDDDGTGTTHPQYGFRVESATYCAVNSGILHGNTAGWYDGGSNTVVRRGPNIVEQTGAWDSPTTVTDNAQLFVGTASTDDVVKSRVSTDTNSRFARDVKGYMSWGPGNAATDSVLYRADVGVLKTDGSLVVAAPSTDTGTVANIDSAQTLTNKTIGNTNTITSKDTLFTLQDDGDATKQAKFELSGITTGNTRTFTLPDVNGTILTRSDTATVSNKTLGTSNTVTLYDNLFTVQDNNDATKQFQLQLSGLTTGNTRTWTVPDSSDTFVGKATTDTLTNKRVTPRVNTTASSATPTINTDTTDIFTITALAANITSMTTNLSGTPTGGQKLLIRIKDDGTPRTITWGASFTSSGVATLLATTSTSKTHWVGLIWDDVASKWVCTAVDATGY